MLVQQTKKLYSKKWRENNKEKCREYCKKWRDKNPLETKKYYREYYKKNRDSFLISKKKYRENNLEDIRKKDRDYSFTLSGRYKSYKSTAKKRELDFLITKEDFALLWEKPCYYCGSNIDGIGIDRVNNSKGYIINNIVPCCNICNKMKLTMSERVFINHCKKIVNFNKKI